MFAENRKDVTYTAVVLAAGSGRRMKSDLPKQYMDLSGKPLIYYALKAFQDSPIPEIVLVVSKGDIDYCRREIVERFQLDKVKEIAEKGQIIEKPQDVVKDPLVLEFLGLQEKAEYSENELETRIIDHLQEFLMEMGKGFTFVDRQKRFTFDEDSYKVDLVLYNRLLRCFVLLDLKIGKLKHQDLGQMQMYVNYYDRYEKTEEENPTIGILLCSDKNDSMVELTLPKDANIYASKYELYLPDKKVLQKKLKQWLEEEGADID